MSEKSKLKPQRQNLNQWQMCYAEKLNGFSTNPFENVKAFTLQLNLILMKYNNKLEKKGKKETLSVRFRLKKSSYLRRKYNRICLLDKN